jgi:hypothetical protein
MLLAFDCIFALKGLYGVKQGVTTSLKQTVRLSVGELGQRQDELSSLVSRLETLAGTTDESNGGLDARIASLEDAFAEAEALADGDAGAGEGSAEAEDPLIFGYCAPHFNMETFDHCHPAHVRMGAEIRYFGKFARLLAGKRPLKFIVTEADGTRPVSKYRYVPRKTLVKGGNPCQDFDMVKDPPASDIVPYEVPDILICVGGVGEKMLPEWRKLRTDVQLKPPRAPFRSQPYWEDGIYWSRRNAPVWKRGTYPLVFMWHMGK